MERSYFKLSRNNMLGVYVRHDDRTNMAAIVMFPIVKIGIIRYYAIERDILAVTEKCESYKDAKEIALKYLYNFDEYFNVKDGKSDFAFKYESISYKYLNCSYKLAFNGNICDITVKTDIVNNKPFAGQACVYDYESEKMFVVNVTDVTKLMFNDSDNDTED